MFILSAEPNVYHRIYEDLRSLKQACNEEDWDSYEQSEINLHFKSIGSIIEKVMNESGLSFRKAKYEAVKILPQKKHKLNLLQVRLSRMQAMIAEYLSDDSRAVKASIFVPDEKDFYEKLKTSLDLNTIRQKAVGYYDRITNYGGGASGGRAPPSYFGQKLGRDSNWPELRDIEWRADISVKTSHLEKFDGRLQVRLHGSRHSRWWVDLLTRSHTTESIDISLPAEPIKGKIEQSPVRFQDWLKRFLIVDYDPTSKSVQFPWPKKILSQIEDKKIDDAITIIGKELFPKKERISVLGLSVSGTVVLWLIPLVIFVIALCLCLHVSLIKKLVGAEDQVPIHFPWIAVYNDEISIILTFLAVWSPPFVIFCLYWKFLPSATITQAVVGICVGFLTLLTALVTHGQLDEIGSAVSQSIELSQELGKGD